MNYKIPYQNTKNLSKLVLDYLNQDEKLIPFVNHFPKLENFASQISEKKSHQIDRKILVKVLQRQNAGFSLSERSQKNIDLLNLDTTFTVVTGHQLCLFTGPLYFIYKIISTLNLCDQLTLKYPSNNFIPIFWMATEDHDFKEVNHIHLFGNKIEWNTKQKGPVGKISLSGFESIISDLRSVLDFNENTERLISLLEDAYLKHDTLTDATRFLVNDLFRKYGLVIIDGDDKDLKKQFVPQIKKDVLNRGFAHTIEKCSNSLAKNYKEQAFIREINFFKLSEGSRKLIKGDITEREIEEMPQYFSPNVLLRPLYQEIVLPNIAYIGGEAEIAYWMQLKTAFDQEEIPFPILVLRNSALLIDEKQQNRLEKLGFQLEDVFFSEDELNKRYLLTHAKSELSLDNEKKDFQLLHQRLSSKISDLGLQSSINAQLKKQLSFLDSMQEKLIRMEKQRNESAINQITKIKRQLFPDNTLQERHDNFIPYYVQLGDNLIKTLKNNFDPLSPNFVILRIKQ